MKTRNKLAELFDKTLMSKLQKQIDKNPSTQDIELRI